MATSSLSICLSVNNLAHVSLILIFYLRTLLNLPQHYTFQSSHEDLAHSAILIFALLYGFFDIFMVLYLTNEITIESGKLIYRIFESDWMDQSQATKNCVVIFCEVLKQPQELAILIYPLSLETFTRVS